MNLLSVVLLIICSSIDCLAKLWVNYLCLNYESMENVFSIIFAAVIICMSLPLFVDLVFLLAHRVHPKALSQLLSNEIRAFQGKYDDKLREPVEWNMWSLDKSYRVSSFRIYLKDEATKDAEFQTKIREDLEGRASRYCAHTTIQIL